MLNMKRLFYLWAFLGLEHKGELKKTYFYEHSDEVSKKNLSMVKSLSVFITIIGIATIIMALTFFNEPLLALIYVGIIVLEIIAFINACIIEKFKNKFFTSTLLLSIYLFHMLVIGSILSTVYSPRESALVFVVVLAISQILFILPPILPTIIGFATMLGTFIISYNVKDTFYFKADIVNCVCVFILSITLGWRFTKIRIEEDEAKNKAIELSKELEKLSLIDQLTNLRNHRSFQNTYYNLFEDVKSRKEQIGIIMIDIDKFKLYNDGHGHLQGDKCLSQIGECFSKLENENIIPFRFGGEEFVVIVKDKECERIDEIAENFRSSVEKLSINHEYSTVSNVVTISLGLYLGKPEQVSMPMQLVDYADIALYKSKKSGGNTVTYGKT